MAASGRKNADGPLLAALAGGVTAEAAAQLSGVSERTVHRRLADPAFRRKLSKARGDMIDRALGKLAEGAADAATTMRNLLSADDDRVKLAAARALLELGASLRKANELEARLSAVEEQLAQTGKRAA